MLDPHTTLLQLTYCTVLVYTGHNAMEIFVFEFQLYLNIITNIQFETLLLFLFTVQYYVGTVE